MPIETHKCPIPGCREACPRHHAMCIGHWRMVPKLLQAAVYVAWQDTPAAAKDHRAAAAKDHRAAVDDAITAVMGKLEIKDARRQRGQGHLLEE